MKLNFIKPVSILIVSSSMLLVLASIMAPSRAVGNTHMSTTVQSNSTITESQFFLASPFMLALAVGETNYKPVWFGDGRMDKDPVQIYRYQPSPDKVRLDGAHFSVVLNEMGRLKGFARLNPDLVAPVTFTKDEAEVIARGFLTEHAPDLLPNMVIQWVDLHDEPVTSATGNQLTLTGMKVKARDRQSGLYFWVIVAADRSVMIFERDINWNFIVGGRQTEKWLHDSWLASKL